jgi:hypothetical protein
MSETADGTGPSPAPPAPRPGEDLFPLYLRQASALLAARARAGADGPTRLSPEFEALRRFPAPAGPPRSPAGPAQVPAWPA